jgi:tripartite-type tricarboxylate transporter receptor subunit TctC
MFRRTFLAACAVAASALFFSAGQPAVAQDYPSKVVTLVVPFPPGGGVDVLARLMAERLTKALGQPVVVDNRVGAGGVVGTRSVAKAAPDGYTLLMGHTGTMAINPSLYANAGYDPRKDFAPLGAIATMPIALVAHPSFGPKTVGEVLDYLRKNPGRVNFGTSAVGTGSYMTAELFKATIDVDMTLVPYRGTAALMSDLLGGHVPLSFGVLPPALGNLKAGKLRAIAVTSKQRFSQLPDVPTVHESGVPNFEAVLYYGLVAPAGTPKPIVDRLNKALMEAVGTPEVQARIHGEGGDPMTSTPDEHGKIIDADETKWGGLVRKLNLKVN